MPRTFTTRKLKFNDLYQFNVLGFITSSAPYTSLSFDLSCYLNMSSGIALILLGFSLGIISSENSVYLFDSHNRELM